MSKNENPISTYAKVSQLAFVIITPLLLFIGGGWFLSRKFGWPDWAMIICIVLGILFMISGAVSYLYKLIKMYEKADKRAPKAFTSSRRENDYYDDYSKK